MNKKVISMLLASSLLIPFQIVGSSEPARAAEMGCVNVDNLVDVTPNHWAYDAVKLVSQELCIMSPKTSTRFMGNDLTNRYEVAHALYNSSKKLESLSGKNLKVTGSKKQVNLNDVDSANKAVVDSIVNEYGLMQAMPGNKFMGNEKMSRYELAFELNNYLSILEKKVGKTALDPINRLESLGDIKEEHWATPAVRNVANKYQVMTGYPDNSFKGYQSLTRYELSAVLRKFADYVNKHLIPMSVPKPTPMPTVEPTPMPTPEPTMEPTPEPIISREKKPAPWFDLKLGGNYKFAYTDPALTKMGNVMGPSGQLNLWFPGGTFGLGLNGDYNMYTSNFDAETKIPSLTRLTAGGELNWRVLGNESVEDTSLVLGAGYEYMQWAGTGYTYANHGPKGKASLEIPLGGFLSLFAENQIHYFPMVNPAFINNIAWKNDAFVGINIPAYTAFSIQLGYKDTRYALSGVNRVFGDVGGLANLRLRF